MVMRGRGNERIWCYVQILIHDSKCLFCLIEEVKNYASAKLAIGLIVVHFQDLNDYVNTSSLSFASTRLTCSNVLRSMQSESSSGRAGSSDCACEEPSVPVL